VDQTSSKTGSTVVQIIQAIAPHAMEVCRTTRPPRDVPETGGVVACHHGREIAVKRGHVPEVAAARPLHKAESGAADR
jgi:hypothetical protein